MIVIFMFYRKQAYLAIHVLRNITNITSFLQIEFTRYIYIC